jgi:hypothetical protein
MIMFADGVEVHVGDRITLEGEPSVVEVIIDTEDEKAAWGLQEIGLMVTNESMGRVFQSVNAVDWNAVEFIARRA